jgi:hypothetical protein
VAVDKPLKKNRLPLFKGQKPQDGSKTTTLKMIATFLVVYSYTLHRIKGNIIDRIQYKTLVTNINKETVSNSSNISMD